jgi:hypothetical protein
MGQGPGGQRPGVWTSRAYGEPSAAPPRIEAGNPRLRRHVGCQIAWGPPSPRCCSSAPAQVSCLQVASLRVGATDGSPYTRDACPGRRGTSAGGWADSSAARLRVTRGRSKKSGADGGDTAWGWGPPRAGRQTGPGSGAFSASSSRRAALESALPTAVRRDGVSAALAPLKGTPYVPRDFGTPGLRDPGTSAQPARLMR